MASSLLEKLKSYFKLFHGYPYRFCTITKGTTVAILLSFTNLEHCDAHNIYTHKPLLQITIQHLKKLQEISRDDAKLQTGINTESHGSQCLPMTVTPFLRQDLVQQVKHPPEISNASLLRHTNNFSKSWVNQMADQLLHKVFREVTILPKQSHYVRK